MSRFLRAYPLEGISIRAGGSGRTVEAYAAVFDVETEIHDHEGHYREVLDPASFNRTISQKGTRFGVLFNHALTVHGTPSSEGTMPIGVPKDVRVDKRGVFTETEYLNNRLADEVLDAIRSGAITAQSFSGRFIQSDPQRSPGRGWRPDANGELPLVRRLEVEMLEYGPAVFAAYEAAAIVGVRAHAECAACAARLEISGDTPDGDSSSATGGSDPLTDEHSRRFHQAKRNAARLRIIEKGLSK